MTEDRESDRKDDSSELQQSMQRLLMPSADEQRAIICSLEAEGAEESLHVYTVSQAWYDRWRVYVGLQETGKEEMSEGDSCPVSYSPSKPRVDDEGVTPTALTSDRQTANCNESGRRDKEADSKTPPPPPGPIDMDLTDDDNISVDEKVMNYIINTLCLLLLHIRKFFNLRFPSSIANFSHRDRDLLARFKLPVSK